MRHFLVVMVALALGLAHMQPVLACVQRSSQEKCCACGHESTSFASCCCENEPSSDTPQVFAKNPVDSQINNPQPTQASVVYAADPKVFIERDPGDQHPVIPPLFILESAFLS